MARIREGWRFGLAGIDSGRVQTARTGRPVRHAAMAMSACTPRSSLPPKPPPQAVGMIRTWSGRMPRISATSSRSMYGACVLTVSSIRSPTRRAQPASGSIYACSTNVVSTSTSAVKAEPARAAVDVAGREATTDQHVARGGAVEGRCAVGERVVEAAQRWQWLPA